MSPPPVHVSPGRCFSAALDRNRALPKRMDLYGLDGDARSVFGWRVGASGELDTVGSFEGLPETVAGPAAG